MARKKKLLRLLPLPLLLLKLLPLMLLLLPLMLLLLPLMLLLLPLMLPSLPKLLLLKKRSNKIELLEQQKSRLCRLFCCS